MANRAPGVVGPARRFAVAVIAVAALVLLAGWFTELRGVMHAVFLALAVAAFLPLVVVGLGVLTLGLTAVLAALSCDDGGAGAAGAELVEQGAGWAPRYYRWLGRQRHPVFWGVPLGLLLGGLLLWAGIALLILPGESLTARILAEAQAEVERLRRETGRYPPPSPEGFLTVDRGGGAQLVLDGFDRPLRYRVAGSRPFGSYVITSLGYDGRTGRDDLCVGGATRGARWLDQGVPVLRGSRHEALVRIRMLACPAASR